MNILFFLKPKAELDLVYEDDSFRDALERIEDHQFSCIPIINEKTGKYVGTICEGDFLREMRRQNSGSARCPSTRPVSGIKRKYDYRSVRIDSNIEELFSYAQEQNFVPVVDDTGVLIGIVTRSVILEFFYNVVDKFIDKEKAGLVMAGMRRN